jgi:PncC family amidohydrolase
MKNIERELSQKLIEKLSAHSKTISLAESCTGGRISSELSKISGASRVFLGSVVSYSNDAKLNILKVKPESLASQGAVSERVAEEMCRGLELLFRSDYRVSVTGIAGPTGGTSEKPVGMVCFCFLGPSFQQTLTKKFGDQLGREEIQKLSSEFVLKELLKILET